MTQEYKIITIPHPALKEVAKPVDSVDDDIRAQMDSMLKAMYDAPGIGLSANQVNILNRVLVMDLSRSNDDNDDDDEAEEETSNSEDEIKYPICMANPEVIYASKEKSVMEEGCLSVPRQYANVERPKIVTVKYFDYDGNEAELKADGLLSHCVQHEIDHLNGGLFIDYLSTMKRNMMIKKVAKLKKQNII